MKEPLKSRIDKFLMDNIVFIGFCLAAVNFGLWQKNVNAGGFVLIVLTTGNLIYKKYRLEKYQDEEFQRSIDRIMERMSRREERLDSSMTSHKEITH